MPHPLSHLLDAPRRPRIVVVGDVMLDRYLWGDVDRISPEAPIPVLRVGRQEHRLGGAGSVSAMLATLGAEVMLVSAMGDDAEGACVAGLLAELSVDTGGLLVSADRATTVKERILGRTHSKHPQQMLRLDRESRQPLPPPLVERLERAMAQAIAECDLLLVSDYDKGVCAGDVVPQVVARARQAGVAVLADPVGDVDYRRYAGSRCITPNRGEAARAVGMAIEAPADGLEAARRLLQFGVASAVVTLDRDGMAWADGDGRSGLIAARPRQVYDITGAGDAVLSALGYFLALGAELPEALELANLAGGLEVERLGVVPVTRGEMRAELDRGLPEPERKIVSLDELLPELHRRRQAGQRIAMTNGCFDLLHPGHVASLQAARQHGDCLVVGLNSDRSVRELKGPGHPIVDEAGRAAMLAALAAVDYVVVFDDVSVESLVASVLPDVLVKSAQYQVEQVVGYETVTAHGGRVVLAPMTGDYSTTKLIERIRNPYLER